MSLSTQQNKAVEKLSKLRAGALFMSLGTGKTKVAIDIIKLKLSKIDFVIWIAPASLINEQSYKEEISKWSKGSKIKYHYFSVESISQSDQKFLEMYGLAEKNKVFCVIDESITIKNTEAKRTKRLLNMRDMFDYRLILNGTPLTKGLIDLYAQITFIHPRILGMTETQFANKFLIYKQDTFMGWRRWSRPVNQEALIEIIRPYIFDTSLDIDCDINYKNIYCCLNPMELDNYEKEKKDFLKNKGNINFIALTQKFQHAYTINSDKYEQLEILLNKISKRKEKVIIYVKYVDEIKHLKESLDLEFAEFTGENKAGIDRFRNDLDVLVCTYGVGSFGLNLQFANNIIYLTQTFDYKCKIQSLHRVYRTGQTKDVNIYNFWVETGLEQLIRGSLNKKESVLNNVKEYLIKGDVKEL